ncbi:unnamed protein product [Effrenium voratum]|nr:unnamed protein product [Effrenium voratum]CAJ1396145.1 unnamed protein product [Effrenium voratum]CAJ1438609.1 unnamed protein product [Effrenium voratum]
MAMCEAACPTCRAPMKRLQPSLVVGSLLSELHVRCMQPGCYWTGRRDERPAHGMQCLAKELGKIQELRLHLEQMRAALAFKEDELLSLQLQLRSWTDHANALENQAKLKQLQLNAKQSMLEFTQREVDDLKCQLQQTIKQHHASHFGHSLLPLIFILFFLLHVWLFYDTLPAVLGIRDCLLASP